MITINFNVLGSNTECDSWQKQEHISCIFAGKLANVYLRSCQNFCWKDEITHRGNWGATCNRQRVCYYENPQNLEQVCSQWEKNYGLTCVSSKSFTLEQQWSRICTVGLPETTCSDIEPN